jgi:hypothetical protein
MSLTDFCDIYQRELDSIICYPNLNEIKNEKIEIKARPLTTNYALVGTAFDYAMRAELYRINVLNEFPCIALNVASMLINDDSKHLSMSALRLFFDNIKLVKTEQFFRSCIIMAKLDGVYRGRSYYDIDKDELNNINYNDIDDLSNLYCVLLDFINKYTRLLKSKSQCILNPTFGSMSLAVARADADFIIDDMLVDIKTTKYCEFNRKRYRQLFMYYCLNKMEDNINGNIESIGIYFSRHGVLAQYNISVNNEQLSKLKVLIEEY